MYKTLIYREDGAVATIQLNRPQKKNSFNTQMRQELENLLHDLARKAAIRAVVITGCDDIFCAGADISEMEGTSSAEAAYHHAREFQLLFDQIESLPQPVIAASRPTQHASDFPTSRSARFPAAVGRKD